METIETGLKTTDKEITYEGRKYYLTIVDTTFPPYVDITLKSENGDAILDQSTWSWEGGNTIKSFLRDSIDWYLQAQDEWIDNWNGTL